jgi:hypothetical protein
VDLAKQMPLVTSREVVKLDVGKKARLEAFKKIKTLDKFGTYCNIQVSNKILVQEES